MAPGLHIDRLPEGGGETPDERALIVKREGEMPRGRIHRIEKNGQHSDLVAAEQRIVDDGKER
jgi:hypothetical protein